MNFSELPLDSMNETDVREEIIAPLLRALGYRAGSKHSIRREHALKYSKAFLGRKKPERDWPLRGKADYTLRANERVQWTLETKPPSEVIDADAVEQSWSYANHPEVRAVYAVLCNGHEFVVCRTSDGPHHPPLLKLRIAELESKFPILMNVLGPDAICRDFPALPIDVHLPLAPGLRSKAVITNGTVNYEKCVPPITAITELQIGILDGTVERVEDGTLRACVRTTGPTRSLQNTNERLGLASFCMTSSDEVLSLDPQSPTKFVYKNRHKFPAGERLQDVTSWSNVALPIDIHADVEGNATGHYLDGVFSGIFKSRIQLVGIPLLFELSGSFQVFLR